MNASIRRIRSPVKRERAEHYLMIKLVSFAAALILTRLFLELTGYPQVGNGKLHIAHVLWGGLLLFVASVAAAFHQSRTYAERDSANLKAWALRSWTIASIR